MFSRVLIYMKTKFYYCIIVMSNNYEMIQFLNIRKVLSVHFSVEVYTSNKTVLLVFLLLVIVLPFVVSTSYSRRVTCQPLIKFQYAEGRQSVKPCGKNWNFT